MIGQWSDCSVGVRSLYMRLIIFYIARYDYDSQRGVLAMLPEALQAVDIRTVKPEEVVDIRQINIAEGLSKQEQRKEFLRQIRNPYCFRVGNVIVKARYSENGVSFNERFEELLMSL